MKIQLTQPLLGLYSALVRLCKKAPRKGHTKRSNKNSANAAPLEWNGEKNNAEKPGQKNNGEERKILMKKYNLLSTNHPPVLTQLESIECDLPVHF